MIQYKVGLKGVKTKKQFHDRIQETIPCPSYYGRNLDALYDVLTESSEEREIIFEDYEEFMDEMPGYSAAFRELCEEAAEECPGLRIIIRE